jgi:hypothetical protein
MEYGREALIPIGSHFRLISPAGFEPATFGSGDDLDPHEGMASNVAA